MTARLLTRAEAAERLRISERTVRRLAKDGRLEEVFVSARSPRITEDSVETHGHMRPRGLPAGRQRLTPEFLARIAEIVTGAEAAGTDPVAAVREAGNTTPETARRWIRRAAEAVAAGVPCVNLEGTAPPTSEEEAQIIRLLGDASGASAQPGLREWRRQRGWSLTDISGLTGFSVSYLSLVERGFREPPPEAKVTIARRLGARVADVFPLAND